ncbi:Golgi-associated PDZ and coiled-coil motif-containing protein-like [Elysia marginata]|uniref:Golgi-associated PDZ and coiled-coil motif-containing protein-like n=1 Tax=Elysia marginata TaxID=1093978 RepID=A0AAV4FG25_9GAST|nr:Golgi-associated PDZ and coiled-coil motif-containing protein-like [Elysia marginata]
MLAEHSNLKTIDPMNNDNSVPPGGKEHGVPILISEIHEGQPAERCGQLYVGDAILSVNGIDLRNAKHGEAVTILSQQQGEISLNVMFVAPDEESDDDNNEFEDEYGFRYRIFDEDVMGHGIQNDLTPHANGPPSPSASSNASTRPLVGDIQQDRTGNHSNGPVPPSSDETTPESPRSPDMANSLHQRQAAILHPAVSDVSSSSGQASSTGAAEQEQQQASAPQAGGSNQVRQPVGVSPASAKK